MPKSLSSISVKTTPSKVNYEAGEYFDPTGLVITKTFSDGTTSDITYASDSSNFSFVPSLSTALTTSNTSVTISYGNKTCSQPITVTVVKTLSSISISGYTTSFIEGATFSFGGTVTATYSDSSTENVTSSATFNGYNMNTLGNQTVTVSYTYKGVEKTASYSITISQGTLSSISVSGMTTSYMKNAGFSFDGTCTATFANGYQKTVTPTSVSSPDMSTSGQKTITVSYTYNGNTVSTSYTITVNAYRTVMEASTLEGQITWPTSATATITGGVTGLSVATSGKTVFENSSMRLGTSNGGGTLTISASMNISKVKISAKYFSSTYSSAVLKVDGQSVTNLTESYLDYNVTLSSAKSSFTILTENSNSRINIRSITAYSIGPEVDIGQSEDCQGLETFIDTYMHMDYVDNLGYCKDNGHHYYSSAKGAFNSLNEHQRSLFTSNSAYTSEWARLQAWAKANNEVLGNNNVFVKSTNVLTQIGNIPDGGVIVIVCVITISMALSFCLLKKRKKD